MPLYSLTCCGCIGIFFATFSRSTRGVFPVNSSEVLRRFVNSCGNIANASNRDDEGGEEMRKRERERERRDEGGASV